MSINVSFKSFAINILSENLNIIDKTQILLSKNKFCSKKQTKKKDKNKQKQDRTNIAKTILKTKQQKILNKEIDRNKYSLIKQ